MTDETPPSNPWIPEMPPACGATSERGNVCTREVNHGDPSNPRYSSRASAKHVCRPPETGVVEEIWS